MDIGDRPVSLLDQQQLEEMSAKTKWLQIRTAVISQQRGACYETDCPNQGMELIEVTPTTWGAFCRKHRLVRQASQIQRRRAERKAAVLAQGLLTFDVATPPAGSEPNTHTTG